MVKWKPCKRRMFIQRIRKLGFKGPYSAARHHFMIYGHHRLAIPSNSEYSVPQLRMLLNEIGEIIGRTLTLNEWIELG